MTIFEIREGAYLELYVLGLLSANEINAVNKALHKNPALKAEMAEIEQSLLAYAEAHAITPSPSLKSSILDQLKPDQQASIIHTNPTEKATKSNKFKFLSFALLLSSLALLMTLLTKQHKLDVLDNDFNESRTICDKEKSSLKERIKLLEALQEVDNTIIKVDPTEKFPGTKLYFHNNQVSKKNFIQVQSLPALAADQSFQLWSLKDDSDPIPLNVFGEQNELVEVDFVAGTNAYAITIEPKGGSKTPNLADLIGVFTVSS